MKNATLKVDLADNKMDDVNELIKILKILTKSNYGVLSGSMIWLEVLQHLGVNAEKEILETFNISDLKTKIYGIKTLRLIAVNTATHCAFLLFKIDENAQKKCCDTSSAAMHLAEIYEDINSLKVCSGLETKVRIKNDEIDVIHFVDEFPDDPVSHNMASNMFGILSVLTKELDSIRFKTGVKIETTVTTDGINIESSKDNLVYRIIIPKRELDEVVDITIPIENALNTTIKKIID